MARPSVGPTEGCAGDAAVVAMVPCGEEIRFDADDLCLVGEKFEAESERGIVLLLHGSGQTRHSWTTTAHSLCQAGWTAVAVDSRGHGDSNWAAPDSDYSIDAFVSDLIAITKQLPSAPVLIGASLGGSTSLLAVGEARLNARGLVLVDIAPRVEPAGIERVKAFMSAAPDGFASLEAVADAIAAYNPHRRRAPTPDGLRKVVRLGDDGRWRWHWDPAILEYTEDRIRALGHDRLLRAARNVSVPTLIVRGGSSDVVSQAGVDELLEAVPHAVEVVVSGAGHMVAGDDNAVFTQELLAFFEQLDTGRKHR